MPATPVYQLPYPAAADPADVPLDMQELADRIETVFVPGVANGQVPVWDNAAKRWNAAAKAPDAELLDGLDSMTFMQRIAEVILGTAGAFADFQNIPQTFKHLLLFVHARGDAAVSAVNLQMRVNGDAAANYLGGFLVNAAAAASGGEVLFGTGWARTGRIAAASAPASASGAALIVIPNYASTAFEHNGLAISFSHGLNTTGGPIMETDGWAWYNVAAINRLTLYPSSGNLAAGSRATLYGLP